MKVIFKYLQGYVLEHFQGQLYGATFLFTALLLAFNYTFDFEDSVIDAYTGSNIRILWYFLAQGFPYYAVCLFVYFFTRNKGFWRQPEFWLVSAFGFLILGINRGAYVSAPLAELFSPATETYLFIFKCLGKAMPWLTIVLPLVLLYLFFHRQQLGHFYGLRRHNVNLRPYFALLAGMAVLIALASFQPAFLKQYPNYQRVGGQAFAAYYGVSEFGAVVLFELVYGFSFIIVELFFRGFLIFGLVKYLGKDVVLPMAVTYCVLHFGKPLGEAISSFFGGYILGIVALKTENIYGGIMVHLGIALLMELFAFWQMAL